MQNCGINDKPMYFKDTYHNKMAAIGRQYFSLISFNNKWCIMIQIPYRGLIDS